MRESGILHPELAARINRRGHTDTSVIAGVRDSPVPGGREGGAGGGRRGGRDHRGIRTGGTTAYANAILHSGVPF